MARINKSPHTKVFLLASAWLCIVSCSSARAGIGDNLTLEKASQIEPGKTTEARLLTMFGVPYIKEKRETNKMIFTYIDTRTNSESWLILSGYLFYNPTWANRKNAILLVYLSNGTVESFYFNNGINKIYLKERPNAKSLPENDNGKEGGQ